VVQVPDLQGTLFFATIRVCHIGYQNSHFKPYICIFLLADLKRMH
jgi:hypothetical protein